MVDTWRLPLSGDVLQALRRAGLLQKIFPQWLDEAHNDLATLTVKCAGQSTVQSAALRVDSNNILTNICTVVERELAPILGHPAVARVQVFCPVGLS